MKFSFQKSSMRTKLICVYLLTATLPVLLISGVFVFIYYTSIFARTDAFIQQSTQQYCDKVEIQLGKYKNILYNMVIDKQIIAHAAQIAAPPENPDASVEVELLRHSLRKMFQEYSKQDEDISSIFFLSEDGQYCDYSKTLSNAVDKLWADDALRQDYYEQVMENGGLTFIPTANISVSQKYGMLDEYCFCIAYPLRDIYSQEKETYGTLIIALEEEALRMYQQGDTDFSGITGVESFIVDDRQRIISAASYQVLAGNYQTYHAARVAENSSLVEFSIQSQHLPWRMISLVDKSIYDREVKLFSLLFIGFSLCTTILFLIVILIITRRYSRSIHNIASGIQRYTQGQKDISVHLDSKDELYIISHRFNTMTQTLNALVSELEQQNIRTEQAVTRRKKAEIKALEAQINPHFLYNTLDSINWMAIDRNELEISSMLSMLGSILRYSITNIDMVVPLEAEIAWMKKYTGLQRNRFSQSFDCVYDIAPDTLGFPIYKLLLQPFFENAILHGFEQVKSGGLIQLNASLTETGALHLEIRDNGKGMSAEQLTKIRQDIANKIPLSSDSIGISNVINRLELYYRGDAMIQIESKEGEGTRVILELPYVDASF